MQIRKVNRAEWRLFRRYHYLNHDLSVASQCYGAFIENNLVAFVAVLHQPHAKSNKLKWIHRLVVLPSYQGLGIGKKLLSFVTQIYYDLGFRIRITTSVVALIHSLIKDPFWKLTFQGRMKKYQEITSFMRTSSGSRITASFLYSPN